MSVENREENRVQVGLGGGLPRLTAIRGAHRGVVTKLIREAEALLEENSHNQELINRLEVILNSLDEKLKTISDFDRQILEQIPVEEIEKEIEETSEITSKIFAAKNQVSRLLENRNRVSRSNCSLSPDVDRPFSINGLSHQAKLPKLTLDSFRGDLKQWRPFWDSFQAAVDAREDIADVDKFRYLLQFVENDARKAIEGLPVTAANYKQALDILQERFGKPQQIIAAHMQTLLKLPSCSSVNEVKHLRAILDKLNINVRSLLALGINSRQYGSLLIPVIMSKMPEEICLVVARRYKDDIWEMDDVLKDITREVEAREAALATKASNIVRSGGPPVFPRNNSATLLASGGTSSITCVYCNKDHFSAACQVVKEIRKRKEILFRDKRCFLCLRKGHKVGQCIRSQNCRKCHRKHHQSICLSENNQQGQNVLSNSAESETDNVSTTTANFVSANKFVVLQTASAVARGADGKEIKVRVLFDGGSQTSYITENLKQKLGLKPLKSEVLNVNTFGDRSFRRQKCDVVEFSLAKDHGQQGTQVSALTFPNICSRLPSPVDLSNYPKIRSLDLAEKPENSSKPIDILIGSEAYWKIVNGEKIIRDSGLVAIDSKLGWLLSGVDDSFHDETTQQSYHGQSAFAITNLVINQQLGVVEEEDQLKFLLRKFWVTEAVGAENILNLEDKSTDKEFLQGVCHDGERYSVNLPWKDQKEKLKDHLNLSRDRASKLLKRLKGKPDLLIKYDEIMRDQLQNGIIEPVPSEAQNEFKESVNVIHYLPHQPVVRDDKTTTKLRIVYDGSAHSPSDDLSINDCLDQGPNLIPLVFGILIRFRLHHIGLIGDIKQAFLMVGINERDRDALRFLWYDDVQKDNPEMLTYRFRRLLFGLKPSPAILSATIKHHLSSVEEEKISVTVEKLKEDLYIDDWITGTGSETEAIQLYTEAKEIMSRGGFTLRKWTSNSSEIRDYILNQEKEDIIIDEQSQETVDTSLLEDDLSVAKTTLSQNPFAVNEGKCVKVLGVNWDTQNDMIFYEFVDLVSYAKSLPVTKRSVLCLSARIFDPLGVLSCFVVNLKILFQSLCVDHHSWDEELTGDIQKTWLSLISQLEFMSGKVRIPRCYFVEKSEGRIRLHGFCDASGKAYAGVVYMQIIHVDHVEVVFVCAKSKVAPLKAQSIPRLELLGALLLARLTDSVIKELKEKCSIENVHCWTDSMTVLCWIKNQKPWGQYVMNRVDEIRTLTSVDSWTHCPGELNPADMASRGESGYKIVNSRVWWKGPEFLLLPEKDWPNSNTTSSLAKEEAMKEIVKHPRISTHVYVNVKRQTSQSVNKIINCESYSSVNKLFRVTAYVLRFIKILKCRVKDIVCNKVEFLQAEEIKDARELWIKAIQQESFSEEKEAVIKGTSQPLYVKQFGLFLDNNGILRCRGRLEHSSLPLSGINPILLPTQHHFSQLIVSETHYKVMHAGVNATLTALRDNYWIPQGRQLVKKFIRHCIVCVRYSGKPFPRPPEPSLPFERVDESAPFTNTGVDLAGPLFVVNKQSKETEKVYICLYTCASTRAVHLDLLEDYSAESFLRSFRRFTSRRGLPSVMMSDNAKNFKAAAKLITRIAKSELVQKHMSSLCIRWDFITEKSPWRGGYWERLIKITKDALKRVIGRSSLSFEEFRTLIVEAECVVNCRPLTYVYDDTEGISSPLCPSHLIYGRRITTQPNHEFYNAVNTSQSLSRRAKHHRQLLMHFAKRWKYEYLLNLREVARKDKGKESIVSVGDIVYLRKDGTARCFWKLAKIVNLLKSRDGVIRSAEICVVSNDSMNTVTLRRPLELLVPTEVSGDIGVKETGDVTLNPEAKSFEPAVGITRPIPLEVIQAYKDE